MRYQLDDTIVAVSSPSSQQRAIVRVSGPDTTNVVQRIFTPPIPSRTKAVFPGSVAIDSELRIDAKLYLFGAPHSYTGDDVAEIHIHTNASVTQTLLSSLLSRGLRMAGPGEFTARAYLNGKMDLAQAEAVNEIIVGSNKFQLAAAERLLAGRLGQASAEIRSRLMDCLSLIEAGLDFSGDDIEEKSEDRNQKSSVLCPLTSARRLTQLRDELDRLLSGRYGAEEVVDLPAVGIAGAPNAGKSSLLNKLLGKARSIVSEHSRTTRDVLTGVLTLTHCKCVLFDCAGLTPSLVARGSSLGAPVTSHESRNILDELALASAIEALRNSSVVVFCIDISKTDYGEDIAIRQLIEPQALIAVATKSDLLAEDTLAKRISRMNKLFATEFIPVSAKTGVGLGRLAETIDGTLIETQYAIRDTHYEIALTARHRQAVTEAIENITESINELEAGNDEVTAMLLRAAYQAISSIEQQNIDEQILERIFSRFCIGK